MAAKPVVSQPRGNLMIRWPVGHSPWLPSRPQMPSLFRPKRCPLVPSGSRQPSCSCLRCLSVTAIVESVATAAHPPRSRRAGPTTTLKPPRMGTRESLSGHPGSKSCSALATEMLSCAPHWPQSSTVKKKMNQKEPKHSADTVWLSPLLTERGTMEGRLCCSRNPARLGKVTRSMAWRGLAPNSLHEQQMESREACCEDGCSSF